MSAATNRLYTRARGQCAPPNIHHKPKPDKPPETPQPFANQSYEYEVAWTKLVKQVTTIYNNTPHSITGFQPIYLMFGVLPPGLSDHTTPYPNIDRARKIAHTRTQNKHLRDKNVYDQRHSKPHFEVGDLVLVKIYHHPNTGKLAPYFTGPYTILEIISPNVVRIDRPNQPLQRDTDTVHVNKLKLYTIYPPIYLMFGVLPPGLSDYTTPYPDSDRPRKIAHTRTQNKHLRDKNVYDQRHSKPHIEVGDLVLVKIYHHPNTGKLAPYFTGPYTILEIISPNVVRIDRPNQPLQRDTDTVHKQARGKISTNEKQRELMMMISDKK
ncbi:hypothetical protein LAZ67_8001194 [Cordylochernes scorpioides]|uniref:Tf2-1-like SH3-like domain-containing protein n=1 Tax=Cordylochernes scorpioides TaxID=51811 RepID=A0ABY6KQI2_9ARAC|nr:hypothetical protein LAZ67_8001194 [Cordylochernes scorpioides]